ncbi:M12 family metallopeptidase [Sphaerotilus mobilis]|uniref:Astacin (Peptidase family M12A) n=1 Tax=Sphaerotilus mobilis TaxID=47994 RepID=A0A4V2EWR9_9BURK|nr:M12 family metallopeptidase [Sphaerotilus mobilis]RZS56950.1 astacin (peptidase family M12A) [Sphaerotilus mobilis]
MNLRPHVCFDRILPSELFAPAGTEQVAGRTRAISPIGKAWMNGSTLRVRFIGGTAAERANAQTQAGWWQAVANLSFVFDDSPQAEIRIAFNANDGAWSYVGTDARSIPADQPTMNLGFEDGGTAAHEFGHAIGLAHEHQNPAGGIQWNEAVVIRELAGAPNFWDEATTRHNVLSRYSADQVNGTEFDPASIMLYFFPAAWTTNGIATRANQVLSALDKSFIGGAKMYPKAQGPTVATAVALTVNARLRTPAAIGTFGEEDLYTFTVAQRGLHVIDTQGPTDVVMKLFGPASPTALIAEDDDSGIGRNARIARALVPGQYWVQVRHYNQRSGVGDYSVRVRRTG